MAWLSAISIFVLFVGGAQASAADHELPIGLRGTVGLLDMPIAHMDNDGRLRLTAEYGDFTDRYSFAFQALPWLQTTFHYTATSHLTNKFSTYYDRSFGLKVRLQKDEGGWPAISVGFLDIAGTSLQSGEYLVSSKRFGPVDVTLGMGWGRLAGTGMFKNPLSYVISSFSKRKTTTTGVKGIQSSGQIQFGQFFRGPKASLFGGIAWQTPIDGLTLVAEYSSDNYALEQSRHVFTPDTQINIGASFQVTDWANFTAAWMYGNTAMFQLSIDADPFAEQPVRPFAPAVPEPKIRSEAELRRLNQPTPAYVEPAIASVGTQGSEFFIMTRGGAADSPAVCARLSAYLKTAYESGFHEVVVSDVDDGSGSVRICKARDSEPLPLAQLALFAVPTKIPPAQIAALRETAKSRTIELAAKQGLTVETIDIDSDGVSVAFDNTHYRTETEAYGRLARVLMETMPPEVEQFRLTSLALGMPTRQITIPRSSLERTLKDGGSVAAFEPLVHTAPAPADPDSLHGDLAATYPRFDWAIRPTYQQSLFDPDQPYRYDVHMAFMGGVDLMRGLRIQAGYEVNLFDDFAGLRASNSKLPHVRSDFNKYYQQGRTGISQLEATYSTTLGRGVYAQVKAGYLESMFAGVGGEVLWRPDGKRWAIGLTGYEVWQRGFDRKFDFRGYHTFTGHLAVYYQVPYYGLNFELRAGRYLAGDYGATFVVFRRFDSGVQIGAFATFTNVPFSKFGEGSFDKGIIISLPIDWLLPASSQSYYGMVLRPLTRDGGQELGNEYELYDATTRTSYEDVQTHFDNVVSP